MPSITKAVVQYGARSRKESLGITFHDDSLIPWFIFHGRLHRFPWPYHRNHGHRRKPSYSFYPRRRQKDPNRIATSLLSIGLYIALMSTFPRCIGLMEGIDIYIPFRSWIVDLSLKTFGELARRRRHDGLSAAHFAGAHQ